MPLTDVKVKKDSSVETKVKKELSVSELKVKKEPSVSDAGSGDAPRKIKTQTGQGQQAVKDVQRKQVKKEQVGVFIVSTGSWCKPQKNSTNTVFVYIYSRSSL